jgi:two-component system, NtrC family, nitrogen regulation sensor histidine kinase NtrY
LSLRARIVLYLVLLHLVLGTIALLALRKEPLLLLAVEVLFVVSIAVGTLLVRAFFVPLDLLRTGAELIGERDFTSQFLPVGSPEMDALIGVYNRMIDRLREERLTRQEQHHFLDRILAASPAGVLTLDYDGRVSQANPSASRLLELPADARGRPLADVAGALGPALLALPVGASRLLPAAGGRRLKVSRAELFDRGFPRSFFVVEELTEELRSSEKAAYEKLIRMMSHEVNNSVGAVGSLLDSFRIYGEQLEEDDRDDFREALAVAATRLDNLRAFMNGFAEVVRLPPPDLRPHDLKRLVDEVVLLLRPELDRRRIFCGWEPPLPEPVPPVALDRNQIEQVLVNVLKNAMESIGEDGRITLRLAREGGKTMLAIRDTGAGIPGEIQPLLFTPFFTTKPDGRGLGLTLVQEILAQHRFGFRLEGRVGEGAELRVWMG